MDLLYSLLTVTGAIVISSPIAWLILLVGNKVEGNKKNKNNYQSKRKQAL